MVNVPRILSYGVTSTDTLFTATLNDMATLQTVATFDTGSVKFAQLQFSLIQNGLTQTGRLLLTSDGITASVSVDDVFNTQDLGIVFVASVSGSDMLLQYSSGSTGFVTQMKYYLKTWI